MKKAIKTNLWSWVKGAAQAGIAGIVAYLCAQFGLGCTTINIPADSGACRSVNVGSIHE